MDSAITAGHYDVTVMDDPIDRKDVLTPHVKAQAVSKFQADVVPTLGGELHVIGHTWWPGDFYDYLKENHLASGYTVVGNKVMRV